LFLIEGREATSGRSAQVGAEAVDEELVRLIEKRSRRGETTADAREESWKASVRAYNAARIEENRQAWREYHQGQAARHRGVLEQLIAHHEAQAARLCEAPLVED
jgi:hypothetical protein